jgi:hypothetical protein
LRPLKVHSQTQSAPEEELIASLNHLRLVAESIVAQMSVRLSADSSMERCMNLEIRIVVQLALIPEEVGCILQAVQIGFTKQNHMIKRLLLVTAILALSLFLMACTADAGDKSEVVFTDGSTETVYGLTMNEGYCYYYMTEDNKEDDEHAIFVPLSTIKSIKNMDEK